MVKITEKKQVQHTAEIEGDLFLFDFLLYINKERHYGADADGRRGMSTSYIDSYTFEVEMLVDGRWNKVDEENYGNFIFDVEKYAEKIMNEVCSSDL